MLAVDESVCNGMSYLGNSSSKIAAYEEFVSFELGLYDYQGEIGLGVHVARHVFDLFDLRLDSVIYALKQPVRWPARQRQYFSAQFLSEEVASNSFKAASVMGQNIAIHLRKELWRRPLCHPSTRQSLQVACLAGDLMRLGVDFAENIVDIHVGQLKEVPTGTLDRMLREQIKPCMGCDKQDRRRAKCAVVARGGGVSDAARSAIM